VFFKPINGDSHVEKNSGVPERNYFGIKGFQELMKGLF